MADEPARPPRPTVGSARWRAEAQRGQEAALPTAGGVTVSCGAPLGTGGLGRHSEEVVQALERLHVPHAYVGEDGEQPGAFVSPALVLGRALRPLGRRSPALRTWRTSFEFDHAAVQRLSAGTGAGTGAGAGAHLIGFNGTSLAQFRAVLAAGGTVSLMSATVHVDRLRRRHEQARSLYPLEGSWASLVAPRNRREYALAERIYVSSAAVWESFLEHGVAEARLTRFPLTPAPRYLPEPDPDSDPAPAVGDTFDIVYVGGLTVDKGTPLLVDAVRRLPHRDLRLHLVGGWKTRSMRRFLGEAIAADSRIAVAPGDPLQALRGARLYVHPTYADGFGYAPAEAMACGVPVIVSEDTGMKDLIEPGRDGLVVATGDLDALAEAIDAAYRGGEVLARL